MSDQEILFSDYKEYEAGGVTFGIGLLNSIDEETSKKLAGQMKNLLLWNRCNPRKMKRNYGRLRKRHTSFAIHWC